jgi:hypothetical protein
MNIWIYDIETLKEMFLLCARPTIREGQEAKKTCENVSFEVSSRKNELDALVKFLRDTPIDYMVGYNNVNFDMQVVEYILRNHQKWHSITNMEIVGLIYKFAQNVIHDINFELFPPYREDDFSIKQIDLFKIHHYDNKNRRTSLKWLEFMMDMDNIEEMPYHHWQEGLRDEDLDEIVSYCWNDVEATDKFYQYTTGNVSHDVYRGKNKVQDRLDVIDQYRLSPKTMNFSDVKIGDELNKRGYCIRANVNEAALYELKKNRRSTAGFTYADCIPDYVQFKTPAFQEFFERMKPIRVNLREKEEYPFEYNGTRYMIAKGGIHSNEKNRILIPAEDEYLEDADVGSQYPNALRKRKLFPSHLGPGWYENYGVTIDTRIDFKDKSNSSEYSSEERRKYKGISEMLKLALNGGGFGKTNEMSNWQYDPFVHFSCTIGNQFEILMLIEMLEMNGIHVVSANTDGIVSLYKKDLESVYYETCREWERIVGNQKMGKLEYAKFTKLWQESVNHYIAISIDGKVKVKGRFADEVELNKNNTDKIGRIERKAIQAYVIHGIPIEKTIKESRNILDFCIGVKASSDYHYETIDLQDNTFMEYKKLIRFYVSKNGYKLIKVKNQDSDAPGAEMTKIFEGCLVTIFNKKVDKQWEEYDIDYEHYISSAQRIVEKVESSLKRAGASPPGQLNLF